MNMEDMIIKMECEDFVIKLARHLDNHEFAENKKCYTADAVITSNAGKPHRAADMSVESMAAQSSNYKPRLLTSLNITPTGPKTAKAFCYCTLRREAFPNAEWHFDLVKTEEGWRCSGQQVVIVERHAGELAEALRAAEEKAKAQKS